MDTHLGLMHLGAELTTLHLKTAVWFPAMWEKVRDRLQQCHGCIQKTRRMKDDRVAACYHPRPKGRVASKIHIDLAGSLPTTAEGYKWILGIVDNRY